jgi:hypothetical protein
MDRRSCRHPPAAFERHFGRSQLPSGKGQDARASKAPSKRADATGFEGWQDDLRLSAQNGGIQPLVPDNEQEIQGHLLTAPHDHDHEHALVTELHNTEPPATPSHRRVGKRPALPEPATLKTGSRVGKKRKATRSLSRKTNQARIQEIDDESHAEEPDKTHKGQQSESQEEAQNGKLAFQEEELQTKSEQEQQSGQLIRRRSTRIRLLQAKKNPAMSLEHYWSLFPAEVKLQIWNNLAASDATPGRVVLLRNAKNGPLPSFQANALPPAFTTCLDAYRAVSTEYRRLFKRPADPAALIARPNYMAEESSAVGHLRQGHWFHPEKDVLLYEPCCR